jgi:hypothetical protein
MMRTACAAAGAPHFPTTSLLACWQLPVCSVLHTPVPRSRVNITRTPPWLCVTHAVGPCLFWQHQGIQPCSRAVGPS